jgi:hypothetical protein
MLLLVVKAVVVIMVVWRWKQGCRSQQLALAFEVHQLSAFVLQLSALVS